MTFRVRFAVFVSVVSVACIVSGVCVVFVAMMTILYIHAIEGVIEAVWGCPQTMCYSSISSISDCSHSSSSSVSKQSTHKGTFLFTTYSAFSPQILHFIIHPLYHLGLASRRKPFPSRQDAFYHMKKNLQGFFSKKRKKFLREIHAKTFTFGMGYAYMTIPPFKRETISSYSSLFRLLIGRKSMSPNVTPPEQSDI